MLAEQNVNPSDKYLACNSILDSDSIVLLKKNVTEFCKNHEQDALYHEFINLQPSGKELAVVTLYAYADMPLPITFDTLFIIEKPEIYTEAAFTVKMSIINGWIPVDQIAHGHKHVLVLKFEDTIPEILTQSRVRGSQRLGLCNRIDFPAIQANLLANAL